MEHAGRQCDRPQCRASAEGIVTDAGHALRDGQVFERLAIAECAVVDDPYAGRQGDGGKRRAVPEGIDTNALHSLGDGHGRQRRAARKGFVADGRHAVCRSVVGDDIGNVNLPGISLT